MSSLPAASLLARPPAPVQAPPGRAARRRRLARRDGPGACGRVDQRLIRSHRRVPNRRSTAHMVTWLAEMTGVRSSALSWGSRRTSAGWCRRGTAHRPRGPAHRLAHGPLARDPADEAAGGAGVGDRLGGDGAQGAHRRRASVSCSLTSRARSRPTSTGTYGVRVTCRETPSGNQRHSSRSSAKSKGPPPRPRAAGSGRREGRRPCQAPASRWETRHEGTRKDPCRRRSVRAGARSIRAGRSSVGTGPTRRQRSVPGPPYRTAP